MLTYDVIIMTITLYIYVDFECYCVMIFPFFHYFLLKERRRVFEANLVKVGLELEIEDKLVRVFYQYDH